MMTVVMIFHGPAPIAREASITPGSMATRFCSTIRATAKVAAIAMTNVAGLRPMEVPMTETVMGWTKAKRIMNGMGRMKFTSTFKMVYTMRFFKMPDGRVV